MQEWLTGLSFVLIVALVVIILSIITHISIDHWLRKTRERNVLVKVKTTFEFMSKLLKKRIKRVEKELRLLIKGNTERMPKMQKTDLTICESILPQISILDEDIIHDFVKISHNLRASNKDIDNMLWFWNLYQKCETRRDIELRELGIPIERIRKSAKEYIEDMQLCRSQMEKLIKRIDKKLVGRWWRYTIPPSSMHRTPIY